MVLSVFFLLCCSLLMCAREYNVRVCVCFVRLSNEILYLVVYIKRIIIKMNKYECKKDNKKKRINMNIKGDNIKKE